MFRNRRSITIDRISAVFKEEVTTAGGSVHDVIESGNRLYMRSVLPAAREMLPGDRLNGGVAMMVTLTDTWCIPISFARSAATA